MFHWLTANKEWLFSGVGVTVAVFVVTWVASRRRKALAVAGAPTPGTGTQSELAQIAPEEVCAAAGDSSLTTFQRSVRHDKYSGQRVWWVGRVADVVGNKSSSTITLWFYPLASDGSRAGHVYAEFARAIADTLLVVKKGDTVTIEGVIQMPKLFGNVALEKPILRDHTAAQGILAASAKSVPSLSEIPVDPSIGVADVLEVLSDETRTELNIRSDAQRFEGKRVHWSGIVRGVSQAANGEYRLSLRVRGADGSPESVRVEIGELDGPLMHAMAPGDQVEIVGTLSIEGRSCRLRGSRVLGHSKASTGAPSAALSRSASSAVEVQDPDPVK